MGRHKKLDRIIHRERFVQDAQSMHRMLIGYTHPLNVRSPHYQALHKVHCELIEAIKIVTGEDAPWIHHSSTGPAGSFTETEN